MADRAAEHEQGSLRIWLPSDRAGRRHGKTPASCHTEALQQMRARTPATARRHWPHEPRKPITRRPSSSRAKCTANWPPRAAWRSARGHCELFRAPFGERKIGRSLPLPFRWGSMHPGDMSAVALFYSPWTFVCRVRALSAAQASRQSQGEQQITAQHIHSPPRKSTPPSTLHNNKTHCETLRDTAHTAHTARRCRYTGGHAVFGTTTANRGSDSDLLTKNALRVHSRPGTKHSRISPEPGFSKLGSNC